MTVPTISTPDDYQRAQKRLEELKRSNAQSQEAKDLQQAISDYERKNPDAKSQQAQASQQSKPTQPSGQPQPSEPAQQPQEEIDAVTMQPVRKPEGGGQSRK